MRVGIFPEREDILICRLGLGGVALHGVGAHDSALRVRSQLGRVYSGGSRFPKIGYRLRKLDDDLSLFQGGGHLANHCTLFLFLVHFVYK
jgi:hypothetical protein